MNDTSNQSKKQQPVSRSRRALYVFGFSFVAVVSSVTMAFMGMDSEIAKLVAAKLLDLTEVLAFIYVSASAFDYTVGNGVKLHFKNKSIDVNKE